MAKKLDLSKLTDDEAKHIFKVVQRDFDLRKKEEDRLGDLKTKIEKEDTKRELLVGTQTSLTDSHCIRCLQPFKFLVNSKRQCLDCQLYTCKSCSRYNKKEHGWVCDPCRMARVLKIGTLEWYHENVRLRFKRFGSAKVMRSLFKRLSGDFSGSQNDLGVANEDDTYNMPEVHNSTYEEHNMDAADGLHYRSLKKTKRLLTVRPFDFDPDPNYSTHSRRQSYQCPQDGLEGGTRESMIAEADMASMFQQILEEQGDQDPEFNTEVRLHFNRRTSPDKPASYDDGSYPENRVMRPRSLSRVSHSSAGSASGPLLPSGYSEEDEDEFRRHPLYQSSVPHSLASQENLSQLAPPQINELTRRMSAIETLLNRLEQKVTSPPEPASVSSSPQPQWVQVDMEELQLRQKLDELTGNISDHGLTSEEDEPKRPPSPSECPGPRSLKGDATPDRAPSSAGTSIILPIESLQGTSNNSKGNFTAGNLPDMERKGCPLEESPKTGFRGSTASVLFELEGKVAEAAANVQTTQSEVSDIENRIAALSAAGMPVDKTRRKSTIPIQSRRLSHNFPTKTSNGTGPIRRKLSIA